MASLAGATRVFNEIYGQWLGLGPDDSPLILRSAGLQQIYLLSFAGRCVLLPANWSQLPGEVYFLAAFLAFRATFSSFAAE